MADTNEKPAVEAMRGVDELENPDTPKDIAVEAAAKGQGVSGYETLSLWETVKTFKVNTAYCFLVAFSAATDGYQIGFGPLPSPCTHLSATGTLTDRET